MSFIVWTDAFNVGVAIIDRQHRGLMDTINRLFEAVRTNAGASVMDDVLRDLEGYTKVHFDTEEKLLKEHGFPDLARHQLLHDALRARTAALRRLPPSELLASGYQMLALLKAWWVGHVTGADRQYIPCLVASQTGQQLDSPDHARV